MTDTPAPMTDAMIEAGIDALDETRGQIDWGVRLPAIYLAMQAAQPVDSEVVEDDLTKRLRRMIAEPAWLIFYLRKDEAIALLAKLEGTP